MSMSWTANIGAPHLWGPGPWDEDGSTWTDKIYQSGDIRPWDPHIRPSSARRILTLSADPVERAEVDSHQGSAPHWLSGQDVLDVRCWCGLSIHKVDASLVAACLTVSCGRPRCVPGASLRTWSHAWRPTAGNVGSVRHLDNKELSA